MAKQRMNFLYIIAKTIASIGNSCILFLKVKGRENTNNAGKVLVVSNHVTWWDPVMMGGVFKHKVNYIAKAELFKSDFGQYVFSRLGAFPVSRGQGDIVAIKKSFEILKEDMCLGIFPEGTRYPKGKMGDFQKGAAAIALKMNAPIIPVYFEGDFKAFRQVKMNIGKAFNLRDMVDTKDKTAAEKGTKILREKMDALKDALD